MRIVLAVLAVIASASPTLAQGLNLNGAPFSGIPRPYMPPAYVPPPVQQQDTYVVTTPMPGGPTFIRPLTPPAYQSDPCSYRLGGCGGSNDDE